MFTRYSIDDKRRQRNRKTERKHNINLQAVKCIRNIFSYHQGITNLICHRNDYFQKLRGKSCKNNKPIEQIASRNHRDFKTEYMTFRYN